MEIVFVGVGILMKNLCVQVGWVLLFCSVLYCVSCNIMYIVQSSMII